MSNLTVKHALLALTNAATEYSFVIPPGVFSFKFQNREGDTYLQYYFVTGQPSSVYYTLLPGAEKQIAPLIGGQTIYFQAVTNAGRNVEIEYVMNA